MRLYFLHEFRERSVTNFNTETTHMKTCAPITWSHIYY